MLPTDSGLVRRIDDALRAGAIARALEHARRRPGEGAGVELVADGVVVHGGPGSPTSQALGLGLRTAIGSADIARVRASFRERERAAVVTVSSHADPSLTRCLRGFIVEEILDVLVRELGDEPTGSEPPCPEGVTIERAGDALAARDWTEAAGLGFYGPGAGVQQQAIFEPLPWLPEGAALLARVGGEPAAVAYLDVRDGVAVLSSAATVAAHRRRGLHAALIAARLDLARAAGCELAASTARPGGTSHVALARRGFVLSSVRLRCVESLG